jgi:ATP-dependent DNA helicase RecG
VEYAHRLELQSPGGLFGNVTVENLEEEHSTRNARFMRMMEDIHVVENRGSGIRAMLQATREANLELPRVDNRRTSFLVTFRNHTLMNPQAIAWLNQFAHVQLNDRQRLALVYLQQHEFITNADCRRLNRVNAMVAGQELRGLVQAGMVDQHGASCGTSYTLELPRESPELEAPLAGEEKILAYVREHGTIERVYTLDLPENALLMQHGVPGYAAPELVDCLLGQ